MASTTLGYLGCVGLIILLFGGVPIAFVLCSVGFVGMCAIMGVSRTATLFMTVPWSSTAQYSLTPMSLFILLASMAFMSGMTGSLFDVAKKFAGKVPGALGIATVLTCTVFGTLASSALVVCSMMTKMAVPEMLKNKYDSTFAHGLTAVSSIIGMLIPPSGIAIMYGVLTNESISKILMSGVGTGLITMLAFCILIYVMVKRNPKLAPPLTEIYTWKEKIGSLKDLWGIIVVAVIMLGGIFNGMFTVTEGAAMGMVGTFIVVVIRKKMSPKLMSDSMLDVARTAGMVYVLLIGATFFSRFLTISGVSNQFVGVFTGGGMNKNLVLVGFLIVFLILGCFLDPMSQMCIMLPLMQPVQKAFGWDPIYFASIMLYDIYIGTVTPPVGLVLFASLGCSPDPEYNFAKAVKGMMPFICIMIVILVLIVLIPPLAIGVVRWM